MVHFWLVCCAVSPMYPSSVWALWPAMWPDGHLCSQMAPIVGYQSSEQLAFMETLCRRYRRSILADLNACLNQDRWRYEV